MEVETVRSAFGRFAGGGSLECSSCWGDDDGRPGKQAALLNLLSVHAREKDKGERNYIWKNCPASLLSVSSFLYLFGGGRLPPQVLEQIVKVQFTDERLLLQYPAHRS